MIHLRILPCCISPSGAPIQNESSPETFFIAYNKKQGRSTRPWTRLHFSPYLLKLCDQHRSSDIRNGYLAGPILTSSNRSSPSSGFGWTAGRLGGGKIGDGTGRRAGGLYLLEQLHVPRHSFKPGKDRQRQTDINSSFLEDPIKKIQAFLTHSLTPMSSSPSFPWPQPIQYLLLVEISPPNEL